MASGLSSGLGGLRPFVTIEQEGLKPLGESAEWENIVFGVDSGATETVIQQETLAWMQIKEGEAFKRGVKYGMANGVTIDNEGEKDFHGVTEEGILKAIKAQVCDVSQPLLSVKKVVAAGNKVVFDIDGSYIESKKDGRKMWLEETQGMYTLTM